MLQIFATAVNAILPIVLMILLGYFLRRAGFFTESFAKTGNKLVFYLFLPCSLFMSVYRIESFAAIRWDIIGYAMSIVIVLFVLGLCCAVLSTKVPQRRGVILQCAFRSNIAIIGISLAAALGDSNAEALASILAAFTVPVYNVLAVIALSVFTESPSGKKSPGDILKNILRNPLIIGSLLGMLCLGLRGLQIRLWGEVVISLSGQGKVLYTVISNLKAVASPFALVMLGGQFTFSAIKSLWREICAGTLFRIVLAPLIGVALAVVLAKQGILNCGINEFPALVALFGAPVAGSSAVMAGQMGNDEQLATQLVVWTSIGSIGTIFVTVCILMSMGLLAV